MVSSVTPGRMHMAANELNSIVFISRETFSSADAMRLRTHLPLSRQDINVDISIGMAEEDIISIVYQFPTRCSLVLCPLDSIRISAI